MMKIAVIGAGAMGCFWAAKLSTVATVRLVSGWAEQVQAISRHGLRFTAPDGTEQVISLQIYADCAAAGNNADLALICVKAHQTWAAAHKAKRVLSAGGLAISLQNGLGNIETLGEVLGQTRVVQGVTSNGVTILKPGYVTHAGIGPTYLSAGFAPAEQTSEICRLFEAAGLKTHLAADPDSIVWGKLVINAGINALTAILQVNNGALLQSAAAKEVMSAATAEAAAVAHAKGITLPYADAAEQVKRVAQATAANTSSMLADVLREAPTEIRAINGAIVIEGEKVGVATPVNRLLTQLVEAIEALYGQ